MPAVLREQEASDFEAMSNFVMVDSETFAIELFTDGSVRAACARKVVEDYRKRDEVSWRYQEDGIAVSVTLKTLPQCYDYLETDRDNAFTAGNTADAIVLHLAEAW